MIVNSMLENVFGFRSKRNWVINTDGKVDKFPVRTLINIAIQDGMIYNGYEKIGDIIIHKYVMKGIPIEVREYIEEKLILSFEYDDNKITLVEEI